MCREVGRGRLTEGNSKSQSVREDTVSTRPTRQTEVKIPSPSLRRNVRKKEALALLKRWSQGSEADRKEQQVALRRLMIALDEDRQCYRLFFPD
jgi:hypothetical protein